MKNSFNINLPVFKNLQHWFPFILFMLLFGYCTAQSPQMEPFHKIDNEIAAIYYPNAINAPLLNNKGAIQVGANTQFSFIKHNDDIFGFPKSKRSFNLHGAYAPTSHFLFTANFSGGVKDTRIPYSFGELAAGYFNTIKTRNPEKLSAQFEVLVGFGKGGTYRKFSRVFLQPTIGINKKDWHFSYSARIARANFQSKGETIGIIEAEFDPLRFIAFSFDTLESNFKLHRNFKNITPYIQYNRLSSLNKATSYQWASDFSSALSFGLHVNL